MKKRLVVGISGSSGAILGICLLEALKSTDIETHLVVTPAARLTIEQETNRSVSEVMALADAHYSPRDIAAPIASGSFNTEGMVVIPCSIKSLSAIANSYSEDLLTRAADVTLKEGRSLLLVVRETPLHRGHIRLLDLAARAGAILFPPVPAFYHHPQTVDEIVDNLVGRVLKRMNIANQLYRPWEGLEESGTASSNQTEAGLQETLWNLPVMTLATTGADGTPHAAAVYFAANQDHQQLYFFSAQDSQHSLDLEVHAKAAATIQSEVNDWRKIRGLQMRGEVERVPVGENWEQAWQCYRAKFPFVQELQSVLEKNSFYRFRPNWIRLIDNQRGFGFKEEWTRP